MSDPYVVELLDKMYIFCALLLYVYRKSLALFFFAYSCVMQKMIDNQVEDMNHEQPTPSVAPLLVL